MEPKDFISPVISLLSVTVAISGLLINTSIQAVSARRAQDEAKAARVREKHLASLPALREYSESMFKVGSTLGELSLLGVIWRFEIRRLERPNTYAKTTRERDERLFQSACTYGSDFLRKSDKAIESMNGAMRTYLEVTDRPLLELLKKISDQYPHISRLYSLTIEELRAHITFVKGYRRSKKNDIVLASKIKALKLRFNGTFSEIRTYSVRVTDAQTKIDRLRTLD